MKTKEEMLQLSMEDIYVCKECGSDQIRESAMLDYNTRQEIRRVFDPIWCDVCDCEVAIVKDGMNYKERQVKEQIARDKLMIHADGCVCECVCESLCRCVCVCDCMSCNVCEKSYYRNYHLDFCDEWCGMRGDEDGYCGFDGAICGCDHCQEKYGEKERNRNGNV